MTRRRFVAATNALAPLCLDLNLSTIIRNIHQQPPYCSSPSCALTDYSRLLLRYTLYRVTRIILTCMPRYMLVRIRLPERIVV